MKAFFVSSPHSGEQVPPEASWLQNLPEPILMCDVDRFVDQLYTPAVKDHQIRHVFAQWHRYAADLNRLPGDIDQQSVEGSTNSVGQFPIGLHWSQTTKGDALITQPMSMELHELLVDKYFDPFHAQVKALYADFKAKGAQKVYHLDAHSMPSVGTEAHRDPGKSRPEIVVSDFLGKSCDAEFKDLVIATYEKHGFEVAYNFPYVGGRVTQTYGKPDQGQHALQVEMNRSLYMDEETKRPLSTEFNQVQKRLVLVLGEILAQLPEIEQGQS